MGLLDGSTQQQYYQGSDYGDYQFTSLTDIINQFIVAYVGEDKIISKVKRTDVAFHAQRALAELSFDTFKSCKAQEIVVPASLQMILPHDYVNYTKISWSDAAGIKHLLYPTSKTSNPFSIQVDDNGNYVFPSANPVLVNPDFSSPLADPWFKNNVGSTTNSQPMLGLDIIDVNVNGELEFKHHVHSSVTKTLSRIYSVWQEFDVSGLDEIELSATGTAAASTANVTGGTLRIGLTTTPPDSQTKFYPGNTLSLNANPPWLQTISGDDASLEWLAGESSVTKSLSGDDAINVAGVNTVYVQITSSVEYTTVNTTDSAINSIDDILVLNENFSTSLQTDTPGSSSTWNNYKSGTPSENQDDYQDDTYWKMNGNRYGLDPQHAQANGSFYIDCNSGKIHFSSNISGKTVILDYISDSLGTDGEMQVHKFAEEAMYKWIAHAVLAGRANVPEYQVNRFKKERFAAIRTAKLRLSNIKLEEITQILRGKSKQIKH